MSAFAKYREKAWPHRFRGALAVRRLVGGVPTDPRVAEGWLRSKLADKDDLIREMVAKTMIERGITAEEATSEVDVLRHLNGFKRNENGLYIEGRQLKAALKEATNVAAASDKIKLKPWGKTGKQIQGFVAEHIMVVDDEILVGAAEPTGVQQRFIHSRHGSAIQYEEYVDNAQIEFTVCADYDFKEEEWAMIWLTGEQQGIGASRSQGFGRYTVTAWERLLDPPSESRP